MILAMIASQFAVCAPQAQAATVRDIAFPVIGSASYHDDFGDPRVGHTHEGNDLLGKKLQILVAAVDGTAQQVAYPEPSYGWYITIEDSEGYRYNYLHINNDMPGTDDGKGGAMNAYAPGLAKSWPVKRGQFLGYMGDSGNAESTSPHLHFEIRLPDDTAVDPYTSLRAAAHLTKPSPPAIQSWELLPFGQFHVGTNIAIGDIAAELPGNEIVVGAAAGSPPQIRVMTATGQAVGNFFLPLKGFLGGVDVAVGDVNHDGLQDIIAGVGAGTEPFVYVLNRKGVVLSRFDAYAKVFRGGVRVSTVDLNGDGTSEIITGAGATGGPDVRTYTMDGQQLSSFYAYTPKFRGGVDVAGVSGTADQPGWIITAAGKGGGPDVRVYSQFGSLRSSFYAMDKTFRGGIRIATGLDPATSTPTILTVPASGGSGLVRSFSVDSTAGTTWSMYEEWWLGGYDVAVDGSTIYGAINTSNRRSSIAVMPWSTTSTTCEHWWSCSTR